MVYYPNRFSNPVAVEPLAVDPVKKFLSNHKKVRERVDKESVKGMCISKEKLATKGMGISDAEMDLHVQAFKMHKFVAAALTDVYCNRDALREIAERLRTSTK